MPLRANVYRGNVFVPNNAKTTPARCHSVCAAGLIFVGRTNEQPIVSNHFKGGTGKIFGGYFQEHNDTSLCIGFIEL
jgi:hypothetical protein